MNLCGCGASAGYPHKPECPRPLYRGSEADWNAWEIELGIKMQELARNDDDPSSPRSEAYDTGRDLRRWGRS